MTEQAASETGQHTPGLRFRVEGRTPAHTTFRVFVGEELQGGNAGLLTFRNEEYDQLAPLLLAAEETAAERDRLREEKAELLALVALAEHYIPTDDLEAYVPAKRAAIAKAGAP